MTRPYKLRMDEVAAKIIHKGILMTIQQRVST
jgi:hypothetical protein